MNIKKIKNFTKDLNILYVEDDISISKNVVETLEMLFNKVVLTKSAEEALARYLVKPTFYDIVLADLYLPNMNGIEMIEKILLKNPNQKLCILTASDESDILKELINLGVENYLSKPLKHKEIIITLYKLSQKINKEKLLSQYQKSIEDTNIFLEKKLSYSQKTNALTGLKNRKSLLKDIKQKNYTMLALIDIDHLDFINNLYNADIGNYVIKKFADFLYNESKKNSFYLYQTSGDEFAICSNDSSSERFEDFIKKLSKKVINLPIHIDEIDDEINLDATIGVTYELNFLANCGIVYESHLLLVQANTALKYAKQHKKSLMTYNESINSLQDIQNIIYWKEKIKSAIKNNNVVPVFQPIVDVNGKILKYESLMRLKETESKKEKLISPYFFLDIAILTKQYAKLSESIIAQTLDHLKKQNIILSINIAYRDLENPNILELFKNNLKSENIGNRLIVEIVESEDIKDYSMLLDFIKILKSYGVKIAIDDFGSGFSNFENIIKFDTDYIKIDGSLVKNIDTDIGSYAIVKAIIQFAHTLNKKVIAEYVHSQEVLEILKKLNVDEYQGFYFYEPSPYFVNEELVI